MRPCNYLQKVGPQKAHPNHLLKGGTIADIVRNNQYELKKNVGIPVEKTIRLNVGYDEWKNIADIISQVDNLSMETGDVRIK